MDVRDLPFCPTIAVHAQQYVVLTLSRHLRNSSCAPKFTRLQL